MQPIEGQPAWQPGLAADLQGIGDALEREGRIAREEAGPWYAQVGHAILDVAGLVPFIGDLFADGLNGLWYLVEGDRVNAGMSFGSMIPFGGWFVQGGRWVKRGLRAEELATLSRLADQGDILRYLPGGRVLRNADEMADAANFRVDQFLTPSELRRYSGDRAWLQPLVSGRRFDQYMELNYPHNQVRIRYGNNR